MVLPSGETRISDVPKSNNLSPSPLQNASHPERLIRVDTTLDHAGIADNTSTPKQTDVGSTDPRLVRNVASSQNGGNEFCFNETINKFTTATSGGGFVEVAYDDVCLSNRALAYRSGSLSGRFARACLLHDVMSPPGGAALRNEEMPTKTSQQNLRCSSDDSSESWISTQSSSGMPNDSDQSVSDSAEFFPGVSNLSLSADEQVSASLSETGTHASSAGKSVKTFVVEELACGSGTSADSMAKEGSSVRKTPEDCGGDFDVYNIEMTLPYMNWDYLEEQLQRAIEKEQLSQSQRNDREKIRQKLAMGVDEDHFGATGAGASDRLFKKPSLQVRLHSAMNLQMCFVNEASAEAECAVKTGSVVERASSSSSSSREDCRSKKSYCQVLHSLSSSTSLASSKSSLQSGTMALPAAAPLGTADAPKEEFDFFTRQARLQAEARLALAQVRPMAHMQLQLEKQSRRKSPIADIVGIPGFGDGKTGRLTKQMLKRMNLGQLQVVVNDMHAQIESFNVELMELLVERDDLHMAQDSMLVDIEDLTRRAQEYDTRLKSKLVGSEL